VASNRQIAGSPLLLQNFPLLSWWINNAKAVEKAVTMKAPYIRQANPIASPIRRIFCSLIVLFSIIFQPIPIVSIGYNILKIWRCGVQKNALDTSLTKSNEAGNMSEVLI
jgi:hypothetical protein